MHDLAVVSTIQSLAPIEGKDRIVLAKVQNYDTIVQKGEFNVGDAVVYVFYDSILPVKPEFEFLRKRCWTEKWQGFRIRPMKLGGIVSEGLVLPMSVLPERKKPYKQGEVVTDALEIRRYDPEALLENQSQKKDNWFLNIFMRYAWFRKFYNRFVRKVKPKTGYPAWIDKSDEENIEKIWDDISKYPDTKYIITEKMEGQAASFSIEKGKFKVYSHNFSVTSGNWVEVAKIYGLEEKMKKWCKQRGWDRFCIQGEVCGPGIQGNIYGFPALRLFLYGGFHSDHTRFTMQELLDFSKINNIPVVPVLGTDVKLGDIGDLDAIIKFADGQSVIKNNNKPVLREGVVWRTEDGRIHFKNKSRQYKVWFDAKS